MRTELLQLRVQPSEKASFEKAAQIAGASLSSWVRERLRKIARAELVNAGEQVPFLQEKVASDG